MRVLMVYLPTLPCSHSGRWVEEPRGGDTQLKGAAGEQDGLSGTRFPFSENRPREEESGPGRVGGGRGQRPGLRQH